ncbi:MAG: AAA family ATPase [bacterium]|nr:AAA family ATPase [bacterium]
MLNNNIRELLSKMTDDTNSNLRKIKKAFGSLEYTDEDNQSLLHILVDDKYDETKCFLAIKSLLQIGLNPNLEDAFNYNFIQTALYAGYSEEFILSIITEALKYNLNVNHVDSDKDTIMHTAIYSDDYLGEVEGIYELLCANGFDSSLEDHDARNLLEAMIFQKQYSREQIESFKKKFEDRYSKLYKDNQTTEVKTAAVCNVQAKREVPVTEVTPTLSDKDILELEKYGKVLNKKNYIVAPTIGREKELKNLMITLAQDKKRPLIVGESGVGKTAIVDELAYRIKTGQVPNFLQGKIILEVNPNDIVAGCQYVGMFEDNMTKLMKLCEKYDVIVFIDEIHTIYGIGSTNGKDNDMASMLKYYIDRSNLQVIGTTTEKEYQEFFSDDALKRRFEKIAVKEPTEDILYQIVDKVIGDYYVKSGISFENENIRTQIVNIILSATEKSHRVYNDMVNNPDLAISIVDKAFAFAKVYDSEFITSEHFIEGFEYCDRIYESTREQAISRLRSLDTSISKPVQRVLKIDFNKFRK